jgi:endonuclease III
MATQSKTQLLSEIQTLLKRRYKPKADRNSGRLSVLSAVVYGICHEDTTREQANQALARFNDEFFDWNEVRVSSVDEIRDNLAGIPQPEEKAARIRRFLRQLFQRTYSFSLDSLTKKPLKEALKVLHTYAAFTSDYVTATVIQQALGGHAIPVDNATARALQRLGFTEATPSALRALLERAIPKNRGAEFLDLIEDLAHDTCLEEDPQCPRCELRKLCAFALARKHGPAHPQPAAKPTQAGKGKTANAAKGNSSAPDASAPSRKRSSAKAAKGAPPSSRSSPRERGRK